MRRSPSLSAKLSWSMLVVLLALGATALFVNVRTSLRYQQEVQQKLNAELAAHIVGEYQLIRDANVNEPALQELFHQLMVVNPSIEVYLLDPRGEILAYSAPEGVVVRRRVSVAPISELLEGGARLPIQGDDPRDSAGTKVFSAAPIQDGGALAGYLYVVLGSQAYDGVARMLAGSYIMRLGAWVVLAALVAALLIGAALVRLLTRPLSQLEARLSSFEPSPPSAGGSESEPTPYASLSPQHRAGGDEVARLGIAFDGMTERIREQIEELGRTDRLRRELVANVSHDLRTPLTQLNGYLETLQIKGDQLSSVERSQYLTIALRESERLRRLIRDLFELAKLDALKVPMQSEDFSLTELANDVGQNYGLAAAERRVELRVVAQAPCVVSADPGLIERTLENLVDNALRHTPEGGTVELRLASVAGRVHVEVCDSGVGISDQERDRIFERFYSSPTTSTEAAAGGGLGLAIAKRAVELHSGTMRVSSTPGEGSIFGFDLPRAHSSA